MFYERTMGWRGRSDEGAWTVAIVVALTTAVGVAVSADPVSLVTPATGGEGVCTHPLFETHVAYPVGDGPSHLAGGDAALCDQRRGGERRENPFSTRPLRHIGLSPSRDAVRGASAGSSSSQGDVASTLADQRRFATVWASQPSTR